MMDPIFCAASLGGGAVGHVLHFVFYKRLPIVLCQNPSVNNRMI
jgi:hypothetical protein